MDAVQQANSGHPGAPMGMAEMAEVLWNDFLQHNPANPEWANRDRFVLSNGHASMLLYSLLHLSGYDLPLDQIKSFRQLHSKTPGHPENGITPGIETTTGPLGQGLANAVGMAIAERTLAAQFNRDGFAVVDHHTYVMVGDGCLMEGISHEVCSLAGTLGLGKLIVLYDDNGISIDGEVEGWFSDDTPARFRSYGWQVITDIDGHDVDAIKTALQSAKDESDQPTLVCCKTVIGKGSPNKGGTGASHGSPLGADEIALVRENIGWTHGPFEIPDAVYSAWNAADAGKQAEADWQVLFASYASQFPELAAELSRRQRGQLPDDWQDGAQAYIDACVSSSDKIATRKSSQNTLDAFGPLLPELIGGSADLAGSNNTIWTGSVGIQDDPAGNYIYYGVREFGMAAIQNGLSLHGGFRSYAATFLIFSEYARNALRMAALMNCPGTFVFTHDSIGLGEDGPTHQPVEQLATLRLIPNMSVWRPCDSVETAVAWKASIENQNGPTSLILTRQGLQPQQRSAQQVSDVARGGYVLSDCEGEPDLIIIATGSEVELAMQSKSAMADSAKIRVVSMPSTDTFDAQDDAYRESVLPASVRKRLVIEAGIKDGWYKYAGLDGKVIGMSSFGESGPAAEVFEHFGFTLDAVTEAARSLL